MFNFKYMPITSKILALLLLLVLALTSCNDNTITEPNTPEESPTQTLSTDENLSPATSEQDISPSREYTDLPVVDCEHEKVPDSEKRVHEILETGYSKKDLFIIDFSEQDSAALIKIFSEGEWAKGAIEVKSDFYLKTSHDFSNQRYYDYLEYSADGIVYSSHFGQHLVLTDRQRATVNVILSRYSDAFHSAEELDIQQLLLSKDANTTHSFLKSISNGYGFTASIRTDFLKVGEKEKVREGITKEELASLLGDPHFIYQGAAESQYPHIYRIYPVIYYYVLDDGTLLELHIEIDSKNVPLSISAVQTLTLGEFIKSYRPDLLSDCDPNVKKLRAALPFLYSTDFVKDQDELVNFIGHTADLGRTVALDSELVSSITSGAMSAKQIYQLLGAPHVSIKTFYVKTFYALSNGKILELTFGGTLEDLSVNGVNIREESGIAKDQPFFLTYGDKDPDQPYTVYEFDEFLDQVLWEWRLYKW